jgi:hypothetical protein
MLAPAASNMVNAEKRRVALTAFLTLVAIVRKHSESVCLILRFLGCEAMLVARLAQAAPSHRWRCTRSAYTTIASPLISLLAISPTVCTGKHAMIAWLAARTKTSLTAPLGTQRLLVL